jgi:hypothetical protein
MNRREELETWTPKLVGERMLAAVRWATYSGGPVGPSGIKGSMPAFNPTLDDHLEEGWGLPEVAGDEGFEERKLVLNISAAQVTAHEAALNWPALYLYPSHEGIARMLGLWLRCKVYRRDFGEAVKRRGTMSRASAFRLRDKGLTVISIGLARDRVKP